MPNVISRHLVGSSAPSRPIFWTIVVIGCFAIGLSGICVDLLVEMHKAAKERARDVASHLVAAIENDIKRNVETIDLSLQAVIDGLNRPDIDQLSPDLRQFVLFDRSATARNLGLIL